MTPRTAMAMVNPSAQPPRTSEVQCAARYTRETPMASEKIAAAATIGQRQRVGQAITASAVAIVVAVVVWPLGKAELEIATSASGGRGRANATFRSGFRTSATAMLTPRYTACTMRPDHHSPPTNAAMRRISSHQVSSLSSVPAIASKGCRR